MHATFVLLAALGLIGGTLATRGQAGDLTAQQRDLLGLDGNQSSLSFVVAGRDLLYEEGESIPIYSEEDGSIIGWDFQGVVREGGVNTDTILYVHLAGSELTLVAIPRDVFVGRGTARINSVFAREGADGLKRAVESLIGLPIDHHAIVDLRVFQDVVDALGGVTVNVPERMYYQDVAAGLTIDFQAGPQTLNGEDASKFIRYRQFIRGDIDRLDNVKRLAYAMLARVKELNVRAVGLAPDLVRTYGDRIETDANLGRLVTRLAPALGDLQIRSATLPTIETERDGALGLTTDAVDVQSFLASTFGGTAARYDRPPDRILRIRNRSGDASLGDWYASRLTALGIPEGQIVITQDAAEPSPTRILATGAAWSDAAYYAELLSTGKQQVERLERTANGGRVDLELVLGTDAQTKRRMPTPSALSAIGDPRP